MGRFQILLVFTYLFFASSILHGQELNCNVLINSERVSTQERQIFDQMQTAISNFMNNTKWTDDEFQDQEKIKCNLLINLGPNSTINRFEANVSIQSVRPVYGTDYESPSLGFNDNKWLFSYNASDPLIFQENTFTTELTSLLAYYAYIILALDYDSFSKQGGNPYLERALNILNNSQENGGPGWTAFDDSRDRYWLIENLNDPQFLPFRDAFYEYHRLALDTFSEDPEAGRTIMLGALQKIQEVREIKPISVMIDIFFDAKSEELMNIFSQGNINTRLAAVEIMSELDPTKSSNYKKILK